MGEIRVMIIVLTAYYNHCHQNDNYDNYCRKGEMHSKFSLPFTSSTRVRRKSFVTISKIDTFLGSGFYQRLYNIYSNVVEAIAKKNYRYLSVSLESALAHKIISQIGAVEQERYKIRVMVPKAKIVTVKPRKIMRQYFSFRQKIWKNQITKIGITCSVYFGQEFNRDQPFADPAIYSQHRVGQFRYLMYNRNSSVLANLSAWYHHQTYEFDVRYSSKMYLNISSSSHNEPEKQQEETQIISQIKLRSGNQNFNWLIIDINDMATQI